MKKNKSHFRGCLLGGAIGDAWGAPVEFWKYEKIIGHYGEKGLTTLPVNVSNGKALITDDTQMTLFTAEGLLRCKVREKQKAIPASNKDRCNLIFRAYLRWLYTQGLSTLNWDAKNYDGWLVKVKELHAYREPGITCITSLGKGIKGTILAPINNSKGCGLVMRVAPIGLMLEPEKAYELGCLTGAITHGHREGYVVAGAMAMLISLIIRGDEIEEAAYKILDFIETQEHTENLTKLLRQAMSLAKEPKGTQDIHSLGGGFLADEALAIALYCALVCKEDFVEATALAVNHDGDSDSTGALVGQILGAYHGVECIPQQFIEVLELRDVISEIACDLYEEYSEAPSWCVKYPGW